MVEPIPSLMPTATVMEETVAAWLEGIPPVRHITIPTSSRRDFFLRLNITTITLTIWARIQLVNADKNTIFSNNGLNEKDRIEAAKDIL